MSLGKGVADGMERNENENEKVKEEKRIAPPQLLTLTFPCVPGRD